MTQRYNREEDVFGVDISHPLESDLPALEADLNRLTSRVADYTRTQASAPTVANTNRQQKLEELTVGLKESWRELEKQAKAEKLALHPFSGWRNMGRPIVPLSLLFLCIFTPFIPFYYVQIHPDPYFNCVSGSSIKISGSLALLPLVQKAQQEYQNKCPGATITIVPVRPPAKNDLTREDGNEQGLADLEAGKADIAISDVFADPTSYPGLTDNQVGVVIFALMISSKVPNVTSLTTNYIRAIYNGGVSNWQDLDKNNFPKLNLTRISRPTTSATRTIFEKYVLESTETVLGPQGFMSDIPDTIAGYIQQNKGAIGYLPLSYANQYGLRVLAINSIAPTPASVKDQKYTFWSLGHMYMKGQATGLAKAFITYMYSDSVKTYASQLGYLNATDMASANITPAILADH